MTQPPPPSSVPPGYPPGPPPRPARPRPSGWWFVVGGGLVALAAILGIVLFVWTLWPLFHTDAKVRADGQAHAVTVATDGDRMLWRSSDVFDPDCAVVDSVSGQQVDLRPVTSQITRDFGSGSWTAAYRFAPGSGELEVTCAPTTGRAAYVEIGPAPTVAGIVGGLVATIAVPGLLGLLGVVALIVTGILWATRPAAPKA